MTGVQTCALPISARDSESSGRCNDVSASSCRGSQIESSFRFSRQTSARSQFLFSRASFPCDLFSVSPSLPSSAINTKPFGDYLLLFAQSANDGLWVAVRDCAEVSPNFVGPLRENRPPSGECRYRGALRKQVVTCREEGLINGMPLARLGVP